MTEKISPWKDEEWEYGDEGHEWYAWIPQWIGTSLGGKNGASDWKAYLQYGLGGYVQSANQFVSSITAVNGVKGIYRGQIGSSSTYMWLDTEDIPWLGVNETTENLGGAAIIY